MARGRERRLRLTKVLNRKSDSTLLSGSLIETYKLPDNFQNREIKISGRGGIGERRGQEIEVSGYRHYYRFKPLWTEGG